MSLLTSRRLSFLYGFITMPCHPFAHTLSHFEQGSGVEARARRAGGGNRHAARGSVSLFSLQHEDCRVGVTPASSVMTVENQQTVQ